MEIKLIDMDTKDEGYSNIKPIHKKEDCSKEQIIGNKTKNKCNYKICV